MKSTGIVRRLDPLGRFTIPKELLKSRGAKAAHSSFDISREGDYIVLELVEDKCVLCGDKEADGYYKVNEKLVCTKCIDLIKSVK